MLDFLCQKVSSRPGSSLEFYDFVKSSVCEMSESYSVYSNIVNDSNDRSVHGHEEEEPLGAAGGNYTPNRREPTVSSGE